MLFRFNKLHYFLLVCLVLTAPALAQSAGKPGKTAEKRTPRLPVFSEKTIKAIIDSTARAVARRYDLTPQQDKVSRHMLETDSKKFLDRHFDEVMQIMPQLYQLRLSQEDPTAEEVKALAERFYPIYQEAITLIISENETFHEILDDRQKKIHDRDMTQMKAQTSKMAERLARWKQGGYQPGEMQRERRLRRERLKQSREKRREERELAKNRDAMLDPTSFEYWDLFVEKFIEAFQLDKGQQTLAYSALNELKGPARAYRKDHAHEFAEIRAEIRRLKLASATQPATKTLLAQQEERLDKLNKPLLDMFDTLRERLMKIPTDQQRKTAFLLLGENGQDATSENGSSTKPGDRQATTKSSTKTDVTR